MSDNLSLFIDYINDNIIYGSEIKREKLENLFNQFAIKNVEKNIVYDELKFIPHVVALFSINKDALKETGSVAK